jgi:hypothetical protein
MERDDRIRSELGVVVCLRDMSDGTSRLFLDDVKADKESNPVNWSYDCFFTFTPELLNAQLDTMQLSDAQFQQIGAVVVARLLALNGRVK